jgi:copper chaperone CopZ
VEDEREDVVERGSPARASPFARDGFSRGDGAPSGDGAPATASANGEARAGEPRSTTSSLSSSTPDPPTNTMAVENIDTIQIDGMHCEHCVASVREALESVEGATPTSVEIGTASVRYDSDETRPEEIDRAVEDAGYAVTSHA